MKKSTCKARTKFFFPGRIQSLLKLKGYNLRSWGYLLAITLLLSMVSCELFDSLGNRDKGYAGSEWSFVITKTHHYTVSDIEIGWPCLSVDESSSCSNFGPSVTTYTGKFKVKDSEMYERGSDTYDLELLQSSIKVRYSHTNWRNNTTDCSPYSGEEDLTSYLSEFKGRYYHDSEDGDKFSLNWDNAEDGNFDFSFASECYTPEFGGYTWTEYYWPDHIDHDFEAEAVNAVHSYTAEDIFEITNKSIKLSCISGCEPEEDPCEEETIYNSCDDFRESMMEFCQTLDDWLVISTKGDSQEIICETADCSDAIDRNESEDPWVGVTYNYNSMCSEDEDDIICQVECYGWADEDE